MTSVKNPQLALLLDVDGPIASPLTRTVAPATISAMLELVQRDIPIIFNTGRSAAFIEEQVMIPLIAAGLPQDAVLHAVCEKGAVWFSFTALGAGEIHVDKELSTPADFEAAMRTLVEEKYSEYMFFDETKLAMVSVEQLVAVPSDVYLGQQVLFDVDALAIMAKFGLGGVLRGREYPASDGSVGFRVDPSIISTDIESVKLGKDLGASRALELLTAQGVQPLAWRTVGDSRTDYAMADWLHEQDHDVKHVDVRPADGVPSKPYPVLTAADLGLGPDVIHDDAGAAFLRAWLEMIGG